MRILSSLPSPLKRALDTWASGCFSDDVVLILIGSPGLRGLGTTTLPSPCLRTGPGETEFCHPGSRPVWVVECAQRERICKSDQLQICVGEQSLKKKKDVGHTVSPAKLRNKKTFTAATLRNNAVERLGSVVFGSPATQQDWLWEGGPLDRVFVGEWRWGKPMMLDSPPTSPPPRKNPTVSTSPLRRGPKSRCTAGQCQDQSRVQDSDIP